MRHERECESTHSWENHQLVLHEWISTWVKWIMTSIQTSVCIIAIITPVFDVLIPAADHSSSRLMCQIWTGKWDLVLLLYSLDESVSGLHQEHGRLSGSTATKMAQSNVRIEIEQPQVFFYFPKDKKMFTSVSLSSVFFYFLLVFLRFSSMKTQRVTYESFTLEILTSICVCPCFWRSSMMICVCVCVCEYSDDVNMSWICISKLRPFLRFRTVPFFRGSSPASYWVNDVKVSSAFGGEVKSGAGIFVILYCLEMQMFSLLKYLILV